MAGSTILVAILLSGCSSVPDAVNPMEWYRGATEVMTGRTASQEARDAAARKVQDRDYPDNRIIPERPKVLSPEERKDLADGLVADRANAKYTQDRINRDGNPTRPLTPKAPQTEPAQPAAPGPAPAAEPQRPRPVPSDDHSAAQPAPSVPPQQVAQARAAESVAPPAPAPAPVVAPAPVASVAPAPVAAVTPAMQPPTPPPVQPVVQPVVARQPSPVDDSFRRRLAQSAPATSTGATPADTAVITPAAMATPRITRVTVEFSHGQARLSDDDAYDLEDLAESAKRSGSRIRVIASAQASANTARSMSQALALAIRRGDAIALELRRNGVPADRIDITTGNDGDRADVGLF